MISSIEVTPIKHQHPSQRLVWSSRRGTSTTTHADRLGHDRSTRLFTSPIEEPVTSSTGDNSWLNLDQQVSGWLFHHLHHSNPTHEQFHLMAEGHDFRSTKGFPFGGQVVHLLVNIIRFVGEPISQLWSINFFVT